MALVFRPQIIPSWVDTTGGMRDSFWSIQGSYFSVPAQLQDVVNAAYAISSAGLLAMTYQIPMVEGLSADSGPYNCGDAATFYLTSTAGLQGVISVPDPDPAIFLSDGVTVDQTDSFVIAFLTQVMAHLGDSGGSPWITVRGAARTRFPS